MKIPIALLACAFACLAAAPAGKWALTAATPNGGQMKVTLIIQAQADSYTGVISNDEGEAVVKDLRVKDSEVSFRVETDDALYEVSASVDGNAMKGSYKVNGNPAGNFSGARERSQ
jgi:hypothetical protein